MAIQTPQTQIQSKLPQISEKEFPIVVKIDYDYKNETVKLTGRIPLYAYQDIIAIKEFNIIEKTYGDDISLYILALERAINKLMNEALSFVKQYIEDEKEQYDYMASILTYIIKHIVIPEMLDLAREITRYDDDVINDVMHSISELCYGIAEWVNRILSNTRRVMVMPTDNGRYFILYDMISRRGDKVSVCDIDKIVEYVLRPDACLGSRSENRKLAIALAELFMIRKAMLLALSIKNR